MELFHLVNRGVDGRSIFADTQDYARFVHDLYEFNDTAPAMPFDRAAARLKNVRRRTSYIRERLVDIHGWVLMKNHYHLLVSELVQDGLMLFLKKLSGYPRYFNDRHKRKGALVQGRTRRMHIEREAHFLYILHYIHLNPLDYLSGFGGWRERDKGPIPDVDTALAYLRKYKWSSYLDYCGQSNFPSLITKDLFGQASGAQYADTLTDYLSERASEDPLEHALTELEYT